MTLRTLSIALMATVFIGCSSDEVTDPDPISPRWDESNADQGELSGDTMKPTSIVLEIGDNYIVGTSVPGAKQECIPAPDGSKTPYYPVHATYTDAFTFSLPLDQKLTKIEVKELTVEQVHDACGAPLDQQLGAFTALADSDKIDWDSDTFENFVKLPQENTLVGAAFAKAAGDDLLAQYKAGFSLGPFNIPALAEDPSNGVYTFWWKEGANKTSYVLNFVVEAK